MQELPGSFFVSDDGGYLGSGHSYLVYDGQGYVRVFVFDSMILAIQE